jgi:hypothetical protein
MSAPLDVAGVLDPGRLLQQLMRLAHDGGAFLLLLADVQQPHHRGRDPHDVAHVDRAEVGEADQLAGGAVEVGAGVEHDHGCAAGGEQGGDGGALDAVVQAQEDGGGREGGAGVAGREEGVGPAGLVQGEADHEAGVGLLYGRRQGLLGHPE